MSINNGPSGPYKTQQYLSAVLCVCVLLHVLYSAHEVETTQCTALQYIFVSTSRS